MSSLNSKYLEINRKIPKLKTHIKFLINNYTFHNRKDAREIINAYETHLNEIQSCYEEFIKNCEIFENVTFEAEQLSIYYENEIKKFVDTLNLDGEKIGELDEDLEFLNDRPTVLETSPALNTSSSDSVHRSDEINISGMQFMDDSMVVSPDDTIFISKNNSAALDTPMVKSHKKKSLHRLLLMRNK